ncbi:MAG: response regulator [Scytolyngbya sp. HA4215-MV1]|jgi:DNA-binding response OmpR family regulator|nr:response regulator [Scytolyngbya sp. HA4215-MV1]
MRKILVIEDEKPILSNILEILESSGFQTISARNGTTGVQMAKEHLPQLILCDIMMPDMDGYGVFSALSHYPATAEIPFIFLTAKAEASDFRQGMNLGVDDYITKPFRRTDLLDAIAARLERKRITTQQYLKERQQSEELQNKLNDLRQLNSTQAKLLERLTEELRQPLSSITMVLHMLQNASSEVQREHYISILKEEFSKEIALINQVSDLQSLLTPENIRLLQNFNLLQQKPELF